VQRGVNRDAERSDESWVLGNAYTDETDAGIRQGVLFPYTQSPGIYKCPADKTTVRDEGKTPRHWSVTMSVAMNFEPDPVRNDLTTFDKIWRKESEITLPSPSGAFVFVDTHEHSIPCSPFTLKVPGYPAFPSPPLWNSQLRRWPRGDLALAGAEHPEDRAGAAVDLAARRGGTLRPRFGPIHPSGASGQRSGVSPVVRRSVRGGSSTCPGDARAGDTVSPARFLRRMG